MEKGTILTQAKIDVSPEGVRITLESLDSDIAKLIASAVDYEVAPPEYQTFEASILTIRSKKVLRFVEPEPEIVTPE